MNVDPSTAPPIERPRLLNFLAVDALWWFAYIVLCYIVGWDFGEQLHSPLFWVVAVAFEAWTVVRWRRSTSDELVARAVELEHGHQTAASVSAGDTARRVLVAFVGIAAIGLIATTFLVDSAIADGRTLLLGDEFIDAGYEAWSESFAALDTELWGLAIYDYAPLVGLVVIAVELLALFVRRRRPEQTSRRLWLLDSVASACQLPRLCLRRTIV